MSKSKYSHSAYGISWLAASAVFSLLVVSTSAQAADIGKRGPYSVSIKDAVKYAAPSADNVIECKPKFKSGHFAGPFPAILLIHGGAWSGGNNAVGPGYTGYSGSWCSLWASWGYDAFSVGYRTTRTAAWPAQIVDIQAAIRWVRANAKRLNINPGMIVVAGDSAGGQLALIAGYNPQILPGDLQNNNSGFSPQPQLIISQFGPWTFGPSRPANAPSVRASDHAHQILIESSDGRTDATTPNTLFVQGTKDTTVNQCSQSEPAYKFLTSNGRPASYLSYNGGHEYTGISGSTWASVVGSIQLKTISFAYLRAHRAGVLPWSEEGPGLDFADESLPKGCPG